MVNFKEYLREKKITFIYQIGSDFKKDFQVELGHGAGFTNSDFIYFIHHQGKKYLHKKAFHFLLTNGDTYFVNVPNLQSFSRNENKEEVNRIENNFIKLVDFLRTKSNHFKVFPRFLAESENFLVFEYLDEEGDWEKLFSLNKSDGKFIYQNFIIPMRKESTIVTPLYNQMAGKVFRNRKTKEIRLVDFKSLEIRDECIGSVLMYNGSISDLYLLERRFVLRKYILAPYAIDYPVDSFQLIKLY